MADDRPGPPPSRRRPSRLSSGEERPFDVWLNRQLHTLYDDIAREPLPSDVVTLIERHGRGEVAGAGDPEAGATDTQSPPADTTRGDKK